MLRIVIFLIAIAVAAAGLAWLADRPGELLINWEGYEIRTSVFHAIVALAMLLGLSILLWSMLRGIWQSPASIGNFFNRRREKRGLEALSSGMIAIGAGDRALATRYAIQARKSLPNEPMTHLLRAQAARLSGDQTTARRIFEAMLSSPDTEQLGLRGLFLEAEKEGEREAAQQFAERALKLNPKLSWPVEALLGIQCKQLNWAGALETLATARKNGHIEKPAVDRKRAVLLTAQAQAGEDSDPERAMNLALEAHNLAPDLIPAAAIAGRLLAARGSTPKAVKVIAKTWKKAPHPDLAVAYAYARLGDSPKDRFERVSKLAAMAPNVIESPIALANAAIEARDFDAARHALSSLAENRQTQRVCTLMARIEGETGNAGGVREWLARAVNAPRDPAWTADGIVADDWAAVSPVTGALDAFQWRVPVEAVEPRDKELLAQKIEELVQVGAPREAAIAAAPVVAASEPAAASAPASTPSEPAPTSATGAATVTPAPAKTGDAVDAEVVEVVKVVSTTPETTAAPAATTDAAPAMKVVDVAPPPAKQPEPAAEEASKPAKAAATAGKAGNGNYGVSAAPAAAAPTAKTAETEVVLVKEAAKKGVAGAAKPAEPKIFVSPRAPDDPGPIADKKN
ncbi:MAG: heme biosynthesis protein HemY [Hyphomicrobiaceae bacterium]